MQLTGKQQVTCGTRSVLADSDVGIFGRFLLASLQHPVTVFFGHSWLKISNGQLLLFGRPIFRCSPLVYGLSSCMLRCFALHLLVPLLEAGGEYTFPGPIVTLK